MALFALGLFIESSGVDYDLPRRIKLDVCAVHRSRRGSFKVYAFIGIAAPVARTLELVLAGFPIGCAAEVSASGVNHEKPFGVSNDPDAVLLLKLCVDPDSKI